ncbi:MAG: hypothetical protein RIG77_19880 [Cyclobacteriaceae bacterium]
MGTSCLPEGRFTTVKVTGVMGLAAKACSISDSLDISNSPIHCVTSK